MGPCQKCGHITCRCEEIKKHKMERLTLTIAEHKIEIKALEREIEQLSIELERLKEY